MAINVRIHSKGLSSREVCIVLAACLLFGGTFNNGPGKKLSPVKHAMKQYLLVPIIILNAIKIYKQTQV